jgi:hypothetical protein
MFFYQAGIGLGNRAFARAAAFWLMKPGRGSVCGLLAGPPCGIAVAQPRSTSRARLPKRAIGYGVEASPLSVRARVCHSRRCVADRESRALRRRGRGWNSTASTPSSTSCARACACVQTGTAQLDL